MTDTMVKAIDGTVFSNEEERNAYEKTLMTSPLVVKCKFKGEELESFVYFSKLFNFIRIKKITGIPVHLNETMVPRDAYIDSYSMFSDSEVLRSEGANLIVGTYQNDLGAERIVKNKVDDFCKRHGLKRIKR